MKIGFIGAGNMASSIIGGLVKQGTDSANVWVSNPVLEPMQPLVDQFSVNITTSNNEICQKADIVVLAVKPQVLKEVCLAIADDVQTNKPLIVSIAAGIESTTIDQWLGENVAMVRCMPNTPSLLQTGASGLFANDKADAEQKAAAQSLFDAVGISVWVESEDQLHGVTAVSGSGPAYFFMFMESMVAAAKEQGLDEAVAKQLVVQTALGAAKMASQSEDDLTTLRKKVTSPGGTTEQAILSFEKNQLPNVVQQAMDACSDRSVELAEILAK